MARVGYCKHGTHIGWGEHRTECMYCTSEREAAERERKAKEDYIRRIAREEAEAVLKAAQASGGNNAGCMEDASCKQASEPDTDQKRGEE